MVGNDSDLDEEGADGLAVDRQGNERASAHVKGGPFQKAPDAPIVVSLAAARVAQVDRLPALWLLELDGRHLR